MDSREELKWSEWNNKDPKRDSVWFVCICDIPAFVEEELSDLCEMDIFFGEI